MTSRTQSPSRSRPACAHTATQTHQVAVDRLRHAAHLGRASVRLKVLGQHRRVRVAVVAADNDEAVEFELLAHVHRGRDVGGLLDLVAAGANHWSGEKRNTYTHTYARAYTRKSVDRNVAWNKHETIERERLEWQYRFNGLACMR